MKGEINRIDFFACRVMQPQFLGALVQIFSRFALEDEEKADNITSTET